MDGLTHFIDEPRIAPGRGRPPLEPELYVELLEGEDATWWDELADEECARANYDDGENIASEWSYVAGDPINWRDPWGLEKGEPTIGAMVGGIVDGIINFLSSLGGGSGGSPGGETRTDVAPCGKPSGSDGLCWRPAEEGGDDASVGYVVGGAIDWVFGRISSATNPTRRPEDRAQDFLDTHFDIDVDIRGSPTAVRILNQAADAAPSIARADFATRSRYNDEEHRVYVQYKTTKVGVFLNVFHELAHVAQRHRNGTKRERAAVLSRREFVKEMLEREYRAELSARIALFEVLQSEQETAEGLNVGPSHTRYYGLTSLGQVFTVFEQHWSTQEEKRDGQSVEEQYVNQFNQDYDVYGRDRNR